MQSAARSRAVSAISPSPSASAAAVARPSPALAATTTWQPAIPTASVETRASPGSSTRLAGGSGGGPVVAPLAWAVAAASRRDAIRASRTVPPAAVITSGEPVAGTQVPTDSEQPFVRSITLHARWTYGTAKTLTFTLNFNEPVRVVDSSVTLPVQVGFAMRDAQYIGGTGTGRLTFRLTVTANDVGAISIGRVSTELAPGATTPARIFDFNGAGYAQPEDMVQRPRIVDMADNPASETIPSVTTQGIDVDARGPGVVSYGDADAITTWHGPLGLIHLAVLTVTFDQAVMVKGQPTVPVSVSGMDQHLSYVGGSGTPTLAFGMLRFGSDPGPVAFYAGGQVIDLPPGADITDRLGNSADVVRGDFGKEPGTLGPPLVENGNTMVVLGSHYEYLHSVSAVQLNTVLAGAKAFYEESGLNYPGTHPPQPKPYWANYELPTFVPAIYGVDLYRVAYQSSIPEQGNRPTTAYGLVAIPQGAPGPLPIVSYQHGAVVGKGEVPSQSFNWLLNPDTADPDLYAAAYETRLNVAQFGGQGYVVIAADYFGLGNSVENDGYISKPSQQQATLDMRTSALTLLAARNVPTSDLFLAGWSQGGLVTLDLQEKLESLGIPVRGVGTASAPGNVQLTSNAWYFNPRDFYDGPDRPAANTPDDKGLTVVGALSNFSITGYAGKTESPLELLGVNYEAARAFYMRQYDSLVFGASGIVIRRAGLADVVLPYSLQDLIAPPYIGDANQVAFSQTDYGQLLVTSGAGQTYLASNMRMYYGTEDQAIPVPAGLAVYNWQTESFGKTNIAAIPVASGNHRGTFLVAVRGELDWFDSLRS